METTGDIEPLKWNSSQTSYFFQALSVPINANGDPTGVEFTHKDPNNEIGNGKVTFGGYKTGLEYFVGATVGPQQLSPHGPKVVITLQRQVAKVIFGGIHHIDINGKKEEYIKDSCDIIFPNLPANATFDMGHFREQQKEYDGAVSYTHLDVYKRQDIEIPTNVPMPLFESDKFEIDFGEHIIVIQNTEVNAENYKIFLCSKN